MLWHIPVRVESWTRYLNQFHTSVFFLQSAASFRSRKLLMKAAAMNRIMNANTTNTNFLKGTKNRHTNLKPRKSEPYPNVEIWACPYCFDRRWSKQEIDAKSYDPPIREYTSIIRTTGRLGMIQNSSSIMNDCLMAVPHAQMSAPG